MARPAVGSPPDHTAKGPSRRAKCSSVVGGADLIQQVLRAGLVDEVTLAVSPVMFGGGPRLFAGVGRDVGVELVETIASPRVTHVRCAARKP